MFEKLKDDASKIELEIKKLRQLFQFALNNYDYHHENNEQEIIDRKTKVLDDVERLCTEFKQTTEEVRKLLETAKENTELYERETLEIARKFNVDMSKYFPKADLQMQHVQVNVNKIENKENVAQN